MYTYYHPAPAVGIANDRLLLFLDLLPSPSQAADDIQAKIISLHNASNCRAACNGEQVEFAVQELLSKSSIPE
jgi:hypothetical protein